MMATKRQRFCLAAVLLAMMLVISSSTGVASSTKSKSKRRTETVKERKKAPHLVRADAGGYRTYIVLLARPSADVVEDEDDDAAHRAWHQSYLPSRLTSLGEPRLRHSYRTVLNGFAARLTAEELKEVARKPGFVRAFPDAVRYLQTRPTRRPSSAFPTAWGSPPTPGPATVIVSGIQENRWKEISSE